MTGTSRLGPHALIPVSGTLEMVRAGARAAKLVGDFGQAAELLALNPNLVLVGRVYEPYDAAAAARSGAAPEAEAAALIARQAETYRLNPLIKVWEGPNEPVFGAVGAPGAFAAVQWYAAFESERLRLLADSGLRGVVGNFATGNPDLGLWPAFLPAVAAARDHGGYLGLHEYSSPWMWWLTGDYQTDNCGNDPAYAKGQGDEGWLTLRYRKVYRKYLEPAGLGAVPLLITECGLDSIGQVCQGMTSGFWKAHPDYWRSQDGERDPIPYWRGSERDPERYYAEQLIWYDQELRKDSYVAGATIFTVGGQGSWANFDIDSTRVLARLVEHIRASRETGPEPAPDPEPPPVVVPPAQACLVGLHGRADGRMQAADWECVRVGRIEALKLLSTAAPEDVDQARALGIQEIVVRCFADFRGRTVSAADFASWMRGDLAPFYHKGVRLFELHNEPNLVAEGLGSSWTNGSEFGYWLLSVLERLRLEFPEAAWGWPGLSPGQAIPQVRQDSAAFLDQAAFAVERCDWIGIHCYWQSVAQMLSEEALLGGGMSWRAYAARWPDKPLRITEFSNNALDVGKRAKADHYADYYARLRAGPVAAAYAFVSSASLGFEHETWRDEAGALSPIPAVVGSRTQEAPVTDRKPPRGKGILVWQIGRAAQGDPQRLAQMAKAAGLRWVALKVHDGPLDYNGDLRPHVAALRAAGISAWSWGYCYGANVSGEAAAVLRRQALLQTDGYLLNAEGEWKATGMGLRARQLASAIRTWTPNLPIGLCSYRYPNSHNTFPWAEFLDYADFHCPQVYWLENPLPGAPSSQLAESLKQLRARRDLPIVPLGVASPNDAGTWTPTVAQLDDFYQGVVRQNLPGWGWWEWGHAERRADWWAALSTHGAEPPQPTPPQEDEMSEETKAAIRASLDVITDAQQSVAAQQAIVAVEVAKISELVQPANPVLFQVRIKAGVTLNVRSIPNSTDPATVLRTVTAASGPLNVYESVRLPGLSFDWYRIAPAQPEWISGHPNYSVVP